MCDQKTYKLLSWVPESQWDRINVALVWIGISKFQICSGGHKANTFIIHPSSQAHQNDSVWQHLIKDPCKTVLRKERSRSTKETEQGIWARHHGPKQDQPICTFHQVMLCTQWQSQPKSLEGGSYSKQHKVRHASPSRSNWNLQVNA